MPNIDTLKGKLTSIANAIRQKTGRSALLDLDEMPTEILSIDGGGGGDVPNPGDPLLLVDWDGTLLYSYTYEDAQQISEFPDAPTHDGLTFQNWTYAEAVAKTWLQHHQNGGQLRVGAVYISSDGQSHNYWRDSRLTSGGAIYKVHSGGTYLHQGEYQRCFALTAVNIPDGVTSIPISAFSECYSLTSVNIPRGLTDIYSRAFEKCDSLVYVNFPASGITQIGEAAFYNCYSLSEITIPSGISAIYANTFYNCCSLAQIDIPDTVTNIYNYAFWNCTGLTDVVIHGKPNISSRDVFNNNSTNQRFYVHRSDLSWFSTATNWSAIYGEGKIVAAADYIEYLQSIGIDTTDFEGE